MAAPHISGIVALMLEADGTLTPGEIKDILQDTSTPMNDYGTWEAGSGYVNAYDAISFIFDSETASAAPSVNTTQLFHDTKTTTQQYDYSLTGYPNPFRQRATLHYTLTGPSIVNLEILDKHGNKVSTLVNEFQERGSHEMHIQTGNLNLAPGIYLARITAGGYTESVRLVVTD
jgi:hypothetical protein